MRGVPNSYDATFNKQDRTEFSNKLMNLIKLSAKLRCAYTQFASVAHEISANLAELKKGRVWDGLKESCDYQGLQIDSVVESYQVLAKSLDAQSPAVAQSFESQVFAIASNYVPSFANLEKELLTKLTGLTKAEKKSSAALKQLQNPWSLKLSSSAATKREIEELLTNLAIIQSEKTACEELHAAQVFATDIGTIDTVCSLVAAQKSSIEQLFSKWLANIGSSLASSSHYDHSNPISLARGESKQPIAETASSDSESFVSPPSPTSFIAFNAAPQKQTQTQKTQPRDTNSSFPVKYPEKDVLTPVSLEVSPVGQANTHSIADTIMANSSFVNRRNLGNASFSDIKTSSSNAFPSVQLFVKEIKSSSPPIQRGRSVTTTSELFHGLYSSSSSLSSLTDVTGQRTRSLSTHSQPRPNLKSALRPVPSVASLRDPLQLDDSARGCNLNSSNSSGGDGGGGSFGSRKSFSIGESNTLTRKSVHFTNAAKPMVEFWDCSDSVIGSRALGGTATATAPNSSTATDSDRYSDTNDEGSEYSVAESNEPSNMNVLRALYPNNFVEEAEGSSLSCKPVQSVEDVFFKENAQQRRVGPVVFFPPQADIESEVGSVVGDGLSPRIAHALSGKDLVFALYRYSAREIKEMSFEKGDLIEVIKRVGNWIYGIKIKFGPLSQTSIIGRESDKRQMGWIPASFVVKYSLE
ncbi:hypothetical protein HK100_003365, partial [Physocladia obscura]